MEKKEVLRSYIDFTTNMNCYDICKRLLNKVVCGWDMARQVNALIIRDRDNKKYLIKVKPGCEIIIDKEFVCISDKDFEHAWTRIEQIKVLGELDVTGMNVIYDMPDIIIDKQINGKFTIIEINED